MVLCMLRLLCLLPNELGDLFYAQRDLQVCCACCGLC